jgi:hypothetical protein
MKMVVRHPEPEDYEALRRIFSGSRVKAETLHSSSELQPRRFAWHNILGPGIKMRFFGFQHHRRRKETWPKLLASRTLGFHQDRLHTFAYRACSKVSM